MFKTLLFVFLASFMFGNMEAQHDYSTIRQELRDALEWTNPDGTQKISKQLRRWEWFWGARVGTDGSLPTMKHYVEALQEVQNIKRQDDVQTIKEWRELGPTGPAGLSVNSGFYGIGRVNVVAFSHQNANVLYLGAAMGGIWKSSNGGLSWTEVRIPSMQMFGVSDIAVSPLDDKVIYVATGDADGTTVGLASNFPGYSYGVIKSTDGGATWSTTGLSYTLDLNITVCRLAIDPVNPNNVLAATNLGVRRTTNGGETWTQTSTTSNVRDMILHPTNASIVYASTFSGSGGAELWKSTNAGATWQVKQTLSTASRIRLAVTKADPSLVWALAAAPRPWGLDGVYRSTNVGDAYVKIGTSKNLLGWSRNGDDWTRGGQGFFDLACAVSPTSSDTVFVGGVNNWRTNDAGQSWSIATEQNGWGSPWVHADQHFLAYHPLNSRMLFACHDGGIARSTNGGTNWNDVSTGLKIQQYYSIATSNTDPSLMLAGSQDNSTILFDGGSYRHVIGGDGMDCAIDPMNNNVMYGSIYNGSLWRSFNRGINWSEMSTANVRGELGAWVTPMVASKTLSATLYAGYRNVWKSTNNGTSWSRISMLSTDPQVTLQTLAVSPTNDNYIYAAYSQSAFYTTNGGQDWQPLQSLGSIISDIEIDPTNPNRVWISYSTYNSGVKVAEVVNGIVTNSTGFGLPNVPVNTLCYVAGEPNRMFAGTDVGVFVTDVGSNTWRAFGENMPTTIIADLEVLPTSGVLRAATFSRGIWEISVSQCTAAKPSINALTSTTRCAGDTIILEVGGTFRSLRWSNGDTTNRIYLHSSTQSGDYSVSIEDVNGCRAVSSTLTITLLRTPSKPGIQRRGDTLRSTALGGATSFQWFFNDVLIPGATEREYLPILSGRYFVLVKNDEGCGIASNEVVIGDTATSVRASIALRNIVVAPNPSSGVFTMQFNSALQSPVRIAAYNTLGIMVAVFDVEQGVANRQLDLSGRPPGVYFLRLDVDRSVLTIPIIIE